MERFYPALPLLPPNSHLFEISNLGLPEEAEQRMSLDGRFRIRFLNSSNLASMEDFNSLKVPVDTGAESSRV